jgi:hypothetical protein
MPGFAEFIPQWYKVGLYPIYRLDCRMKSAKVDEYRFGRKIDLII